jgi:hypothetical protein
LSGEIDEGDILGLPAMWESVGKSV